MHTCIIELATTTGRRHTLALIASIGEPNTMIDYAQKNALSLAPASTDGAPWAIHDCYLTDQTSIAINALAQ